MHQHFVFLIAGAVVFSAPTYAQAGFLDALARAAMKAVGATGETAPKTLPKATAPLAKTNPHVPPGKLPAPGKSPELDWAMPNHGNSAPKLDRAAPEMMPNWKNAPKDEGATGAESSVGGRAHTKSPVEYGVDAVKKGGEKALEEGGKKAIENVLEEPRQETYTEYPHQ